MWILEDVNSRKKKDCDPKVWDDGNRDFRFEGSTNDDFSWQVLLPLYKQRGVLLSRSNNVSILNKDIVQKQLTARAGATEEQV